MFSKKVNTALFFYWLPFISYAAVIFYLSHQSDPTQGVHVPVNDKVIHLVEFTVLGFLAVRAFCYPRLRDSWKQSVLLSILFCFLYAAFDECHQYFIPGRTASVYDFIADVSGALLGTFLWVRFFCFRTSRANAV
jgi:VanZ family protein